MSMTITTPNTILGLAQPTSNAGRWAMNIAIVVLGSLLLAVSAQFKVPTWPVPVTLQTLAVAGIAGAFGWRIGVGTVVLYLVEGLSGLPVFASGGGPLYLFGPTGGFLLGYIPMALIIGFAADRGASKNFFALFAVSVLADAVVFALGFAWLIALAGETSWIDQSNVVASAYSIAIEPFIIWDIVKMALAAMIVFGGYGFMKSLKK